MVLILRCFLLILLMAFTSALSAEVFQWKDANGNTVFGDTPPESAGAKEVDLPMLTIADRYSRESKEKKQSTAVATEDSQEEEVESKVVEYKRFVVKSPGKGETIRANNGSLMIRLDLKPALQEGHGIALYMDGKQVANESATVFSLTEVDRGEHSLFAVLHDENKSVLKNTEAVKFTLLRASKLN